MKKIIRLFTTPFLYDKTLFKIILCLMNVFVCGTVALVTRSIYGYALLGIDIIVFPLALRKGIFDSENTADKKKAFGYILSSAICLLVVSFFVYKDLVQSVRVRQLTLSFHIPTKVFILAFLVVFALCSYFVWMFYIKWILNAVVKGTVPAKILFVFMTVGFSFVPAWLLYSKGATLLSVLVCSCISVFFVGSKSLTIAKRIIAVALALICVFGICFAVFWDSCFRGLLWNNFSQNAYSYSDQLFFKNKNVMIIIPHEDDDINLAGGIIKQYVDNNSSVTLVFATNGDYYGVEIGKSRFDESISVADFLGISKENVIFLGYGDQWQPVEQQGKTVNHIYNSSDKDYVWTSHIGLKECYGTDTVDCFNHSEYTRENYLTDIKNAILSRMPDTLYVVDYDSHPDHRAVSQFFEEAMGLILKENQNYHPDVYKGFCYSTAWTNPYDFYDNINILQTANPSGDDIVSDGIPYLWSDRTRIPVDDGSLARKLDDCLIYKSFAYYASQRATIRAGRVTNSDKIVWKRQTDSLLYNATVTVDGVNEHKLNDFKLIDSEDITGEDISFGNVDVSKGVKVALAATTQLNKIVLYDDPAVENNIKKGKITFGDGSSVEFGDLNNDGTGTEISFDKRPVNEFVVTFEEYDGKCQLSEIEGYNDSKTAAGEPEIIAPMDQNGNFPYDYYIEKGDSVTFSLYSYPKTIDFGDKDIVVALDGDEGCSYSISDSKLTVVCPKSKKCTVKISYKTGEVNFTVSNPGICSRFLLGALQKIDYIRIDQKK